MYRISLPIYVSSANWGNKFHAFASVCRRFELHTKTVQNNIQIQAREIPHPTDMPNLPTEIIPTKIP